MISRLAVICENEKETVFLVGRRGVRKLGEYTIRGNLVDYVHLDREISFRIGRLNENNKTISLLKFRHEESKVYDMRHYSLVYFLGNRARFYLDIKDGMCAVLKPKY